jgi:tight adherence protein C
MELLIISLLGVFALVCFVFALVSFAAPSNAASRLQRLSGQAAEVDFASTRRGGGAERRTLKDQLVRLVLPLSGRALRDDRSRTYDALRQRLVEAGFRGQSALGTYIGSRIAVAGGLSLLIAPFVAVLSSVQILAAFGAAALAGFLLPGIFVDYRRRRRQLQVQRGLPDSIDLMVVCVEAGLSLAATLNRVADEFQQSNTVLASEIKLAVLETQAGKSLADALRGLAARAGVSELSTLVSALIQTERLGTQIADTLRVQSEAMRVRRLQMAEEIAQKAPVKMLFPAAVLIFPALLIMILYPAVVGIVDTFRN